MFFAQGGPGRGVPFTWTYVLGGRCRGDGKREGNFIRGKRKVVKGEERWYSNGVDILRGG